ncbi:hypothetical protein GCM10007036_30990 [Alsobacter metallidurans]|uniref:Helix-turn-helix domain-containing protein n=1 Tax=Alsobacter metallidurans TaxID=340221 RepID=A0A917I8L8_9HYPH|nr:hypothetical protein [Alsobacter metallidurans]GGH24527.1 hypothetical protein GCM10007036_30990 [Alsobacter metallidurans]
MTYAEKKYEAPDISAPLAYNAENFLRAAGIGKTKLHEEINAGRLKALKVGRRLIITHDDAKAWLNSLPARHASKKEVA